MDYVAFLIDNSQRPITLARVEARRSARARIAHLSNFFFFFQEFFLLFFSFQLRSRDHDATTRSRFTGPSALFFSFSKPVKLPSNKKIIAFLAFLALLHIFRLKKLHGTNFFKIRFLFYLI